MLLSRGEKIFHIANTVVLLLVAAIVLYPFLHIFAVSLNDGRDALSKGIYLWPRKFSFAAYELVFKEPLLARSAYVSVFRTAVGTLLNLIGSAIVAYVLANRQLLFRRTFIFLFLFTMYFTGGLIPEFLLIRSLGLYDQMAVYLLPGLVAAMPIMIMRQFFEDLPQALLESARIDGATEFRTLMSIVIPMSAPVMATMALMYAVGHWTSWYDTYFFTRNDGKLATLQGILVKILMEAEAQRMSSDYSSLMESMKGDSKPTSDVIRMATITITTVPVVCIYPFLQKYFVSGMRLGAVKE